MFNTSAYYRFGIQKFEITSITPSVGSDIYYRSDVTFTITFNQNLNDVGGSGFACGLQYADSSTSYVFVFQEDIIDNSFSVTFGNPHVIGPAILQLPPNTLYGNINNHFLTNLSFNYNITGTP